jgi:septum formation protein
LDKTNFTTPSNYAIATATGKAEDVLNNELSEDEKNTSYLLIACDTVVESPSGEIFEKPKDAEDATRMLRMLSNETHRVHSGVVVFVKKSRLQNIQSYSFSETTSVSFAMIPESLILSHSVSTSDHDKAGGYAIQGRASAFCKEIKGGSYSNIVGLPIHKLGQLLREISTDL